MKAKYRRYTKLYMIKLRYILVTSYALKSYSKYYYYIHKLCKWQKQRDHLFRKFPNKYGFWETCNMPTDLTAYTTNK